MIVYRISKSRYAKDLNGEGSRKMGGRWNHVAVPCIYTAESRALAILELTVNVNIDDIPRALCITSIEIPEKEIRTVSISELPGNWKDSPAPASTKDLGTKLLREATSLIIKIPSTVIPAEYNYLINPLHHLMEKVKITDVTDFIYDVRIKEK